MKITALEESSDFATLDIEKLFSKLKFHELSRKSHPNHDASFSSKALITGARVGGHVANPTNTTDSSALEFVLSSLCAASDEQYESIPDDEIALLVRKFRTLHRFHKERRRSPRGCFECGDTIHFIADCPKRKKFDSSNKYNYNNRNDSSDKDEGKKKKFQKMMSRACAALSDLDFSNDDSSSSEEDERPKRKTGDFTGLCLMGKSSRHISDFDFDISDDSSPESLSSRVVELENALCNQDKLLCKIFRENKRLNLELESSFSEIASLRSVHDDMSVKPCARCTMIMINYADLWFIHSHFAGLLDGARLELRELKARSTLLGACTSCPVLRSDLEAAAIEIKDLKHKLDHSSRYTILSPPCEACVSLKGKLLHATKENTELQQEVAYLTARLEKSALSEKMIQEDLSQVEESATKSTYRLVLGLRDVRRKVRRVLLCLFLAPATIKKRKHSNHPKPIIYPIQSHPSTQKREVRKETPKPRDEAFVCVFCGRAGHLDEFCFRWKRIERRRVEYARDSYRDDFFDFPPQSYSRFPPRSYSRASPRTFPRALPHTSFGALHQFAHGPNHRSYGFGPRENCFEPRRFGYDPRPHRRDRFPRRPGFPAGE
jgi:regulator of replication initiation timing